MNTFNTVVRHDLKSVVGRVFVLALLLVSSLFIPDNYGFFIFLFFGSIAVIPALIQKDTPAAVDSFFITRPLNRSELLAAKTATLGTLFILLPSLFENAKLLYLGLISPQDLWETLPTLLLFYGSLVLPLILIAAGTKKLADFLIVYASAALAYGTLIYFFSMEATWGLRAFYYAPTFEIAKELQGSEVFAVRFLWASICVLALCTLYDCYVLRKFSRIPLFVVGGLILGILPLINHVVTVKRLTSQLDFPSKRQVEISEAEAILETKKMSNSSISFQVLRLTLTTLSDSPTIVHHPIRMKKLAISDDKGSFTDIPAPDIGYMPCVKQQQLTDFLSDHFKEPIKLLDGPECPLGTTYTLPQQVSLENNKIAAIEGEAYGLDYELNIEKEVPANPHIYKRQRETSLLSFFLPFVPQYYYSDDISLALTERMLSPFIKNSPEIPTGPHSAIYAQNYASARIFVLVNRQRKEAFASRRSYIGDPSLNCFVHMATSTEYFVQGENAPSSDWLKDALFISIRPHVLGAFISPVSLRDVSLKVKQSSK
ncbi:MAG: hypothetical protein GYA55_08000 [SAR324 cluster bacterium]|uniref:Uncharacterized protein n=1 Tax=SAR324 cluster bacterium TaxID=2024889 RepID=A0A7X9FRP9_9DELT|nr:hypothetical protein [SAR324 cluster bacterium]